MRYKMELNGQDLIDHECEILFGEKMNFRIRKKKEKQSLMEYSFETVIDFPYKRRKQIINKQWRSYHEAGDKIIIGYKRKPIE